MMDPQSSPRTTPEAKFGGGGSGGGAGGGASGGDVPGSQWVTFKFGGHYREMFLDLFVYCSSSLTVMPSR